jgi:hypothetical protein
MSFQWDMLLLECGFLAIFLPWGSTIIIWLYRWLVFRYMLLSGLVKIRSADTSWESLTALSYHFETQPLPTPIAWYAHHLPETVLRAATGMTLAIELFVPVLLFAPRRFRHFAAWCFLLLQAVILLTGNYNFFNLLSIIMCLFLFDDAAITRLVPRRLTARLIAMKMPSAGRIATGCAILMAAVSVILGGSQIHQVMFPERGREISSLQRVLAPFAIINSYGPFAVMTRERNEIVIEGLGEERTWHEYRFKYKPGDPERCPGWVAPHQPRIDWQMWFAALSTPQREPWFQNLLLGLLQNTGPVTAIFADNPFPDKPPRILRARFYRYTFTSYEERRETGRCWNRQLLGDYIPPVILR